MNILSVENLHKRLGERVLFQDLTFGISKGEKVALVGINGVGKSTLLSLMCGKDGYESGGISFRKGTSIGFLPQQPQFDEQKTIWQSVFEAENEIIKAIKAYEDYSQPETYNQDKLDKAMMVLNDLNGWDFEYKIKEVLSKLGLNDVNLPIKALSGGQRKRVALAKALLQEPDFLILDEPTNHLDLEMIEWLEHYLSSSSLTLLMVTHDRYFLDNITNCILELENGKIYKYIGNYAHFLEKKDERMQQMAAETDKARNLYRRELDWVRRQPKARGTKAKYRLDAFEQTKEVALRKNDTAQMEIKVQSSRQGKKILEIKHLHKAFGEKKLIGDFSYTFQRGDRIGIVGKNGLGKTSFLNIITGKLPLDDGELELGETTNFGYYEQQEKYFDSEMRVMDVLKQHAEIIELAGGETVSISQFLTLFNFPPKRQYEMVAKLSGGEKRRLQLVEALLRKPNFLLLDEPTNDLDIDTLSVLESFLINFPGCILMVSHDRCFMDNIVNHLFVFEGDGKIRDYYGNYTDYRNEVDELKKAEDKQQKAEDKNKQQKEEKVEKVGEKKTLNFNEKKEYERLEQEIESLEKEKSELMASLASGAVSDHKKLEEMGKRIQDIEKLSNEKSDRWLYLSQWA